MKRLFEIDFMPNDAGVGPVESLVLRDDLSRFKQVLREKAGVILGYLENHDLQALWIQGLPEDLYGVGRNPCVVWPNDSWTFNMVSHVHEASHLDLLASRTEAPNRSPFHVFSMDSVGRFIRENHDVIAGFLSTWSASRVSDRFIGNPNLRDLEAMMFQAFLAGMDYKNIHGEWVPSSDIREDNMEKWAYVLSTILNGAQAYVGGEELKQLEKQWQPDSVVDWAKGEGRSCVIFRGMHRGSAQVARSVQGSADIMNSVLFTSTGFRPGW